MTGPDAVGDVGPDGNVADDTATVHRAARQAARLLRWYPKPWRERYGEEFLELLISDIAERPGAPGRILDVARGGIMARLNAAGLTGFPLAVTGGAEEAAAARTRHVAASLGSLGAAVAVFLIVGAAQWSQILISWVWTTRLREQAPGRQWPADVGAERALTLATSAAIIAFLAIGVLAALPVLATVIARLRTPGPAGQRKRLAWPAVTLLTALAVLFTGGRAMENNWIGTGGLHSPVPGGLAAFIWAVTLFVSTYWAHPAMFAAFPAAERGWMALSPLVLAVAVASAVVLIRHAGLSPRVARFEARLGIACCAVMTAFLAICAGWLAYDGPLATRLSLFHAGWINVAGTGVLALTLAVGLQATRTVVRGLHQARRTHQARS